MRPVQLVKTTFPQNTNKKTCGWRKIFPPAQNLAWRNITVLLKWSSGFCISLKLDATIILCPQFPTMWTFLAVLAMPFITMRPGAHHELWAGASVYRSVGSKGENPRRNSGILCLLIYIQSLSAFLESQNSLPSALSRPACPYWVSEPIQFCCCPSVVP